MKRIYNKIEIYEQDTDKLKFDISILAKCEINTSRQSYTDTAVLEFPNNLRDRDSAADNINIGDKVIIYLGYYPVLVKEFIGFISFIDPGSPLKIELEDRAFQLKRISLPATTFTKTSIVEVIEKFYTGKTVIVDAELGDLRISESATLVKVLDLFKSKYGILSYFKDDVLYINSSLIEDNSERTYLIHEQRNVPAGSTALNFQKNDDLTIISHGISERRDGTKLELYATYKDNVINTDVVVSELKPVGTLNTLKVPNLSKEALTALIIRRLPLLFYTGVTGSITTFGYPSISHGDTVKYTDDRIPARGGYYRTNEVVKTFGPGIGYRQKITLGLKVRK